MPARSHVDIHNIRMSIERIGNVSDSVIRAGPLKIGLDGILEFIPYAGEVYSAASGLMLIAEGWRARVPASVLLTTFILITLRTLIGAVDVIPFFGPVVGLPTNIVSAAFRAHKMCADMMIKAIDETVYVEASKRLARETGEDRQALEEAKADGRRKRIVFLG